MSSLWSLRLRWADYKVLFLNGAKARVKNKNAILWKLRLLLSNAGYTSLLFYAGKTRHNIWMKSNNPWSGMALANSRGTLHCLHPANVTKKISLKVYLLPDKSAQYLPRRLFICAYLLIFPPWLIFYSVDNVWSKLLLCHQRLELFLWLLSFEKFHCVVIWTSLTFGLVNQTNIPPHKSETQPCVPHPHSPGSCGMEYQWN